MDKNSKTFIMHVAVLEILLSRLSIYLDKKTQIAFLLIKKITISNKYLNFADDFLEKKALMLPDQTNFNKYVI